MIKYQLPFTVFLILFHFSVGDKAHLLERDSMLDLDYFDSIRFVLNSIFAINFL